MLKFLRGDIFASSCQALTNPVNCEGVMGKGLAKIFKDRWPEMYKAYQVSCTTGELRIGQPTLWKGPEKWIVNFPTKEFWRRPSTYDYIDQGLGALQSNLKEWSVGSLAMPALGCGLGGLEWAEVKKLIVNRLETESILIEVYEP